jgi:hypothetical protein
MKIRLYLCACALLLACAAAVMADETTDQYSMLMKPAAAANAALQKNVTAGDWAATASSATDVQNAFAKIEAFWTMKGVADAQGFAKTIQAAAKETHDAAAAGNADGAKAAAMKVGATCGMCHMAHRMRNADGTFTLKQ